MICHECGMPCRAGSAKDWDCCCTDACKAHHRDCGRGGYACLMCRTASFGRLRSWSEMIVALEFETGRPVFDSSTPKLDEPG